MSKLDYKLDVWQNKLLDLGLRNRLLNYRDTRRSNLRIKSPDTFDLWNSFVVNEEPLVFPFVDDYQASLFDEEENFEEQEPGSLVTNQPIKEQQKTLRNLRNRAKTAMEEQGVNVLYLSFGFLRWSEDTHSNQYFDAPIILVPAVLTWESITSPFVLSLHEDEIVLNPTLVYKLESDFGINLPEFDAEGNLEIYLQDIQTQFSTNNWKVMYETSLGLLSFLKVSMYRDLEMHRTAILANPIIRALGGDDTAVSHDLSEIDGYDHDRNAPPATIFQVVDADSSQQDAILCAKKGLSFVLQGPPGTGKSQTITNIIAECLAAGKKVLFVSEKMAALDVVHKRLTDTGLAEFCLILHSYKANKKDILTQLDSILSLAHNKASLKDEAYQKLDLLVSDRERLNEYSEVIFLKVLPLNKTIYEVNGYIANLQNYSDIVFTLLDVRQTTPVQYNRYINTLNRFTATIGKMSDDYRNNPWRGAKIDIVTYELRHDIGSYLKKLIPKVHQTSELCDEIENQLQLKFDDSYHGLEETSSLLALASQSPTVPVAWIYREPFEQLFDEINVCVEFKSEYERGKESILSLHKNIALNNAAVNFSAHEELMSTQQIALHLFDIETVIMASPMYSVWSQISDWPSISALYEDAHEKISEYNFCREELLRTFEKEIFDIDYDAMYLRFKSDYTSFFKIFNKQYKADKRCIQGLHRELVKKVSDDSIYQVLVKVRHLDEIKGWMNEKSSLLTDTFSVLYQSENTDFDALKKSMMAYCQLIECTELLKKLGEIVSEYEEMEYVLREHFEFLYNGINTDWAEVLNALNWAKIFRSSVPDKERNRVFIEHVCNNREMIKLCDKYSVRISESLSDMDYEFCWFLKLFDEPEKFRFIRMPVLLDRLNGCTNGLAALEEWIDFRTAKTQCCDIGLGDYIEKIESLHIDSDAVIPIFKKRFFRLWLDSVLPEYPIVANFRRRVQESIIKEFVSLDKLQFEIAKARIRSKLINDLPSLDHFTSGVDEISVLKRELSKRRRIKPIRKLFREIPNLILTLKPCLMMSPLSVSLFLEADSFMFDTVIFDEASQVCTENAIGAISRGRQVIIAGDSKQLPPTNFFTAATSNADYDIDSDDDDEYDDPNAFESVLDEATMLPERTLRWHYRSRHEHLIAFSNAKIYKNNLITFPSNVDKASDLGVEYVYVKDGFYERGGKKGNVIEAKKVADLVFNHFRNYPSRSLGVVAFGEIQQQAIDMEVRRCRKENQTFEEFFNEGKTEPFFIKNLENVQGDERDTIIFSIGYAKDVAGVMHMNFGPLSKSGGERRLNVAITRAKCNVKLVGSIHPTDINIDRIKSDGPKLLRGYIDFAINGPSVLLSEITESDIVEHDSPFEAAVYNFLDRKGYKLSTQVGCSGYRIDMAVKHPTVSGQYILGIECDGAAYHSARTARERDRLRQAVLEDMGWKIYRVWSTDWIKDPVTEGKRLIAAVEKAIGDFTERMPSGIKLDYPRKVDDFLTVEEKIVASEEIANPYGFAVSKETYYNMLPRDYNGFVQMTDCIELLVKNEYPIHIELLYQKLSKLLQRQKATSVVRHEVDYALTRMNGKVVQKGNFFYPRGYTDIPARANNNRQIKHISTDELADAMFIIAEKCIGTTREALINETTRVYGFNRRGNNISSAMQEAYELLLSTSRIKEMDGKVVVL